MRIWTCEAKIKKERITDEEKIIAHISPILQNSVTPTFPNSLFDQESGRPKTTLWICYLQINQLFLFSFLIYFFIPLNLSNSNGQGCKQFFFLERKKVRWGHHFRLRFYTVHQTKCSTGWKVHLGVPFTGRNDLNRTKIWMPRRSKFESQIRGHLIMNGSAWMKSPVKFFNRSKIRTALCELQLSGHMHHKSCQKYLAFTLCNFCSYYVNLQVLTGSLQ